MQKLIFCCLNQLSVVDKMENNKMRTACDCPQMEKKEINYEYKQIELLMQIYINVFGHHFRKCFYFFITEIFAFVCDIAFPNNIYSIAKCIK